MPRGPEEAAQSRPGARRGSLLRRAISTGEPGSEFRSRRRTGGGRGPAHRSGSPSSTSRASPLRLGSRATRERAGRSVPPPSTTPRKRRSRRTPGASPGDLGRTGPRSGVPRRRTSPPATLLRRAGPRGRPGRTWPQDDRRRAEEGGGPKRARPARSPDLRRRLRRRSGERRQGRAPPGEAPSLPAGRGREEIAGRLDVPADLLGQVRHGWELSFLAQPLEEE